MEIALAVQLFHGKENYNCAQAVLKAFQNYNKLTESQIAQYKSAGGGRAQGGVCGALYAAKLQLNTDGEKSALEESFKKVQCVETAAKILKNQLA